MCSHLILVCAGSNHCLKQQVKFADVYVFASKLLRLPGFYLCAFFSWGGRPWAALRPRAVLSCSRRSVRVLWSAVFGSPFVCAAWLSRARCVDLCGASGLPVSLAGVLVVLVATVAASEKEKIDIPHNICCIKFVTLFSYTSAT